MTWNLLIPCAEETLQFCGEDNEEPCKDELNSDSKPETSSLDECILKIEPDIEVKVEEDLDHVYNEEDENDMEVLKEECIDYFDFLVKFEEDVKHVYNEAYNVLEIPKEAVAHDVKRSDEDKIFMKEEKVPWLGNLIYLIRILHLICFFWAGHNKRAGRKNQKKI